MDFKNILIGVLIVAGKWIAIYASYFISKHFVKEEIIKKDPTPSLWNKLYSYGAGTIIILIIAGLSTVKYNFTNQTIIAFIALAIPMYWGILTAYNNYGSMTVEEKITIRVKNKMDEKKNQYSESEF